MGRSSPITMLAAYVPTLISLLLLIAPPSRGTETKCDLLFSPVRCGVPKLQTAGMLPSRESEAIHGEFPWHAALYHEEDGNFSYCCGGSLISERFVLTAAHCVINPNNGFKLAVARLKVKLGVHEIGVDDECVQEAQVARIHAHPGYEMGDFKHDLAVIKLLRRVVFTNLVLPICVDLSEQEDSSFYRQYGKVPGWGYTEKDSVSNWLRMTEMPFVNYTRCLGSNPDVFANTIYEGMFCAGYGNGTSVCNGDSGGGLVAYNRDHWILRGIVSFTALRDGPQTLCDTKEYAGFIKVRHYRNWLKNITEHVGIEKDDHSTEAPVLKPVEDSEEEPRREPCGERKINKRRLIVNGVRSYAGEWPWHVAVYEINGRTKRYICGGTLISDQYVMTAAHCMLDDSLKQRSGTIVVQLGQDDLYESSVHMREVKVGRINTHEKFDPVRKVNDIALLELTSTVQFNDYIQPACLPSKEDIAKGGLLGQLGSIAGWGYQQPWSFMVSNTLQSTRLPIVDSSMCSLGADFGLETEGILCMGSANETNACTGDSGGGMFLEKDRLWFFRGVISALDTVNGFCKPDGFLKVTDTGHFVKWIRKEIRNALSKLSADKDRKMSFLKTKTEHSISAGEFTTSPGITEIHYHHHHYYPQPTSGHRLRNRCKQREDSDSSSESHEHGLRKLITKKKCFIKGLTDTLLSKLF